MWIPREWTLNPSICHWTLICYSSKKCCSGQSGQQILDVNRSHQMMVSLLGRGKVIHGCFPSNLSCPVSLRTNAREKRGCLAHTSANTERKIISTLSLLSSKVTVSSHQIPRFLSLPETIHCICWTKWKVARSYFVKFIKADCSPKLILQQCSSVILTEVTVL